VGDVGDIFTAAVRVVRGSPGKTGIEELAYLDQLKPLPPSATLQAIGQMYQDDKKSPLTSKECGNSKTWWDEFVQITGAESAAGGDP